MHGYFLDNIGNCTQKVYHELKHTKKDKKLFLKTKIKIQPNLLNYLSFENFARKACQSLTLCPDFSANMKYASAACPCLLK